MQLVGRHSDVKRNYVCAATKLLLTVTVAVQGEHGTGRNVAPFVEMEWGSKAYDLMWELKALFDPNFVLNPGVVLNRVWPHTAFHCIQDCLGMHCLAHLEPSASPSVI